MTGLLVVLDLVDDVDVPEYCTHGKTTCVGCGRWCWLGDKTYQAVAAGHAKPVCLRCMPSGMPRVSHIGDHLRADGPH